MGQYVTNRCCLRTWQVFYLPVVLLAFEFWDILLMLKIIPLLM